MSAEVEEIKRRLDVVDMVGEYVRLNPGGGQSMKGLCPFHSEKSPSFFVHRDKQFWHCFGCSEGGDIISFYQKIENLDFRDALKDLARRAGVELPEFRPKEETERGKILAALEDATRFFDACLKHETIGTRARAYVEKRGLKPETIAEFRIGYAPNAWDTLTSALVKKEHAPEILVAAGLSIRNEKTGSHYDRFRDRVMIPLRDERGTVVGFTGRILPDNPEADKTGKYVNSPETLVYRKRKVVFALDRAREHVKAANFVVLVEGNMDAVMSHQAGVKNVAAVSGTAFAEEQIDLIKRFASRIALAFDADAAGQNAISRAIPHAWRSGMQVMTIAMPPGLKDPDEVIAKDPELWKKAIADAKDVIAFAVDKAFEGVRPEDPFSKKKAIAALKPTFDLIDDKVLFDHWVHAASERLLITEVAFKEALAAAKGQVPSAKGHVSAHGGAPRIETREERLAKRYLSLILSDFGRYGVYLKRMDPAWIPEGPLRTLAKTLKSFYTADAPTATESAPFFASYEALRSGSPELPVLGPIVLLKERDMAGWTDEQLMEEASICERALEELARKRAIKELQAELHEAERRGDAVTMNEIAKRFDALMRN